MFESLLEWLRSLLGRPSNPLANLDPTRLRDQMALLDVERERMVNSIERKEVQRSALKAKAQQEAQASGAQSVRVVELARQITYIDQEIADQRAQLEQVHRQRRALYQFVRFAEEAERMRKGGLDKILGRHVDMRELQLAIENGVAGDLNSDKLDEASRMLEDAIAMTRREVNDPDMLRVLDEITAPVSEAPAAPPIMERPVAERPAAERAPTPPAVDPEVEAILRDIERDL